MSLAAPVERDFFFFFNGSGFGEGVFLILVVCVCFIKCIGELSSKSNCLEEIESLVIHVVHNGFGRPQAQKFPEVFAWQQFLANSHFLAVLASCPA